MKFPLASGEPSGAGEREVEELVPIRLDVMSTIVLVARLRSELPMLPAMIELLTVNDC